MMWLNRVFLLNTVKQWLCFWSKHLWLYIFYLSCCNWISSSYLPRISTIIKAELKSRNHLGEWCALTIDNLMMKLNHKTSNVLLHLLFWFQVSLWYYHLTIFCFCFQPFTIQRLNLCGIVCYIFGMKRNPCCKTFRVDGWVCSQGKVNMYL